MGHSLWGGFDHYVDESCDRQGGTHILIMETKMSKGDTEQHNSPELEDDQKYPSTSDPSRTISSKNTNYCTTWLACRQARASSGRLFNPIQARGALCAPSPISQHISKTAWSLELLLGEFSFYVYSFQKSLVPPISPHVCCHGNHATFWLIFENSNLNCFSSISSSEKLSVG